MMEMPRLFSRSKTKGSFMKGLFQVVGIKFLFDWILIGTALYVALLVADDRSQTPYWIMNVSLNSICSIGINKCSGSFNKCAKNTNKHTSFHPR